MVRKGGEICYHFFDKLRDETSGGNFLEQLEKNIEEFGDKFLKEEIGKGKPTVEYWKKIFDPRVEFEL